MTSTRILRRGDRDDGLFDLLFWQEQGPEAILAAAHEMIAEAGRFNSNHDETSEPRLQRHLVRIIRSRR